MARTIRTPKIYRSRREFLKAIMHWKHSLDFATNPTPLQLHNANPLLATITIEQATPRTDALKAHFRHANRTQSHVKGA